MIEAVGRLESGVAVGAADVANKPLGARLDARVGWLKDGAFARLAHAVCAQIAAGSWAGCGRLGLRIPRRANGQRLAFADDDVGVVLGHDGVELFGTVDGFAFNNDTQAVS